MKLSGRWTLDARFLRGKMRLLQLDSEGKLEVRELKSSYPFYFDPLKHSAEEMSRSLIEIPFVVEVSIEDWLMPPWYDSRKELVKVEVDCAPCFKKIARRIESMGIAKRLNLQPSSESLALMRIGITMLDWEGKDPWRLEFDFPPLRVMQIKDISPDDALIASSELTTSGVIDRNIEKIRKEKIGSQAVGEFTEGHHIALIESRWVTCEEVYAPVCIEEHGNPVEDLIGLMELSRLSYSNLDETAEKSIGKILTDIEAMEAVNRRMAVPQARLRGDAWRGIEELLEGDSGGLVGLPRPGIYENVLQLDFSSLYPTIIAKFNISPETINRPNCERSLRPPGSMHEICMDIDGLVASTLKRLVDRREKIRSMNGWMNSRREKALKWIMVASFGYLGYRNSRFGSVPAYESVVSIARELMRKAIVVASQAGYEVIHFIVDSIFAWKQGKRFSENEAVELKDMIERSTGMKIKFENVFRYLVIPRTEATVRRGAPNRYYGVTSEGRLIVKGVKCPEIDGTFIPRDLENAVLQVLLLNEHPRRLCFQLSSLLNKSDISKEAMQKNTISL